MVKHKNKKTNNGNNPSHLDIGLNADTQPLTRGASGWQPKVFRVMDVIKEKRSSSGRLYIGLNVTSLRFVTFNPKRLGCDTQTFGGLL